MFNIYPGCIVDGDFLPPNETAENFSICFTFDFVKPLKIWAHLDNSFFHSFQVETKGKLLNVQGRMEVILYNLKSLHLTISWFFQDDPNLFLSSYLWIWIRLPLISQLSCFLGASEKSIESESSLISRVFPFTLSG